MPTASTPAFTCDGKQCGTLSSDRNLKGEWDKPQTDAWFNPWFQTLRTAYGMVHTWPRDERHRDDGQSRKRVESCALFAAQWRSLLNHLYGRKQKMDTQRWLGEFTTTATMHLPCLGRLIGLLRWAEDLIPARKAEVLAFVKPYADFLLANQEPSGVIPSWYYASTLVPRKEFRDFNAETAASALLLATLGEITGDQRYIAGAEKGMSFIEREVLPRQRWFDYETYLSCARKDYSFFDSWDCAISAKQHG